MALIDYGQLEQWIVTVEEMFKDDNLTVDEQLLVIDQLRGRIAKRVQEQKMADAVANVPLKGLMKRVISRGEAE